MWAGAFKYKEAKLEVLYQSLTSYYAWRGLGKVTYQDSPPARNCHFRQQPYSISTKARMGLCRNISDIQVLVTNFFRTPNIKLKLGLQVGGKLYVVTVFIGVFQGTENCGFLQGASSLPLDLLMSLIQDFQCRFTYGTLVEILLFWLPMRLPYYIY